MKILLKFLDVFDEFKIVTYEIVRLIFFSFKRIQWINIWWIQCTNWCALTANWKTNHPIEHFYSTNNYWINRTFFLYKLLTDWILLFVDGWLCLFRIVFPKTYISDMLKHAFFTFFGYDYFGERIQCHFVDFIWFQMIVCIIFSKFVNFLLY